MLWFVEERNSFGGWSPALYHGEKPSRKAPDQDIVWRGDPVLVPKILAGFGIRQINSCMSVDGEFNSLDFGLISDFFREGTTDALEVK
tara:strand:- start:17590 stop:17853 length:264 start_codon:yes stop_codon:yes gene_type:complete